MVLRGRRSFKRFLVILITFFISGICINSYTGSFSQSDGFIVTFEELLEGPVVLQQNDTQLLEHIRENVFINPEDYEVGLERLEFGRLTDGGVVNCSSNFYYRK